ncbi:MATE family efflux transporter [Paludibacterium denitrificans]|uniref:MATE family efflux transporter n=1 Tax=Paludibacterium denitrificans TaxID=2675226 RepID=UPI0035E4352E
MSIPSWLSRVSTDDLAAVSLGASVFLTVYVTLLGIVTALNPILSHQLGSGERAAIGETARRASGLGCS